MNRKRWLILFALLLPLAIFGAAKWAARWRPVAVGVIVGGADSSTRPIVTASAREIVVIYPGFEPDENAYFDLSDGTQHQLGARGLTRDASAQWRVSEGQPRSLTITRAAKKRVFAMPSPQSAWMQGSLVNQPQVLDSPGGLKVLVKYQLVNWKPKSSQSPTVVDCQVDFEQGAYALARDGATIIDAREDEIAELSTQTGNVVKRIPVTSQLTLALIPRISPFGAYALYEDGSTKSGLTRWRVVDASDGRALWRFDSSQSEIYSSAMSLDETLIAIPLLSRKVWQVHDVKSGRLLRALPLMPGAHAGAFSPDNSTLYSVANGVLYRQRAR